MGPLRSSGAGLLLAAAACSANVDLGSNGSDTGAGGSEAAGSSSLGGSGGAVNGGTSGMAPGAGGAVFTGGNGGAVFNGGNGGTAPGTGGMGTGGTYGFIGGVMPTCGPDSEIVPPQCTGIQTSAACPSAGVMCPELPCGLADLGHRTCACDGTAWSCSLCEFPPQLTLPSGAPPCVDQRDGLACSVPGQLCLSAPLDEVCLCWPDDECLLVWDCDRPPVDSTVVSPE